jgi:hypothetical protein
VAEIPLTAEAYREVHKATIEAVAKGEFTIVDAMDSLPWFRTGGDWTPWRAFLCALYGLPMTPRELEIYRQCTGRFNPPTERAKEVWVICGRRAKKSAVAALIAVWRALFYAYPELAPGERGKVPIIAATKREAKQIRTYALNIIMRSKLRGFLASEEPAVETIPLTNGIDIEIVACNLMAGRSYSSVVGLLDEVAFFRSEESANPDEEIVAGVKAGMSKIPGSFIGGFSSPYAKRGVLYKKFQEHFGKDSGVLVWKASSVFMDPENRQLEAHVADAWRTDPVAAACEYGAEFRSDVLAFIPEEKIDKAMSYPRSTLWIPPQPDTRYFAFCDPSGGAADDMTLGIAHVDLVARRVILDVLDVVSPPFVASAVAKRFSDVMKQYGLRFVTGDHYGREFVVDAFRQQQVGYLPSELSKSDIYLEFLPLLMGEQAELPKDAKLRSQLVALDRKVSSAGREIIDHPPEGKDDMANAAAGACTLAAKIGLKLQLPAAPVKALTPLEQRNRDVWAQLEAMKAPQEGSGGKWRALNTRGGR